ncbi:MAG: hypothetical protein II604_07610 [Bacteroidales bacterium]|nr:hypothetical protein [Bacteroidales bacterium]
MKKRRLLIGNEEFIVEDVDLDEVDGYFSKVTRISTGQETIVDDEEFEQDLRVIGKYFGWKFL